MFKHGVGGKICHIKIDSTVPMEVFTIERSKAVVLVLYAVCAARCRTFKVFHPACCLTAVLGVSALALCSTLWGETESCFDFSWFTMRVLLVASYFFLPFLFVLF